MPHKTYNIGDKVWFIPGYRGTGLIAIECAILEINSEGGCYLDEPIGRAVYPEELIDNRIEAIQELIRRQEEELRANGMISYGTSLDDYRQTMMQVIASTHRKPISEIPFPNYQRKEAIKQWLNIDMAQMELDLEVKE